MKDEHEPITLKIDGGVNYKFGYQGTQVTMTEWEPDKVLVAARGEYLDALNQQLTADIYRVGKTAINAVITNPQLFASFIADMRAIAEANKWAEPVEGGDPIVHLATEAVNPLPRKVGK